MKKTIRGFLAALALTCCLANVSYAQSNTGANNNGNAGEERPGVVIAMDSDGNGSVQDQITGQVYQFKREGAIVAVIIGDAITFRLIILPNGRPPLVVDVKETN